ncbi:hypothetical protein FDZ71_12160, partial [bacterium]
GWIIDLFPPFYDKPLRLEFFGDDLESIRTYDPSTQRSLGKVEEAVILPAREVIAGEEEAEEAYAGLKRRCHKLGMNRSEAQEALAPFSTDPLGPGREPFLSYYSKTATLWDFIPEDAAIVLDVRDEVMARVGEFFAEAEAGAQRAQKAGRLSPELSESYVAPEKWLPLWGNRPVIEVEPLMGEDGAGAIAFETRDNLDLVAALRRHRGEERLLTPLAEELLRSRERGHHAVIVAQNGAMALKLREFLREYGVVVEPEDHFSWPSAANAATTSLCIGSLARGFRFPGEKLTLITQAEIFGMKGKRPAPRRGLTRTSLGDLKENDLIVHADFGIGRFRGMTRITVEGVEGDYLHLEYAGGDKLYLPVTRMALIQRYTAPGGEEGVALDKIGGVRWEKAC